jgi:hypothetical protein
MPTKASILKCQDTDTVAGYCAFQRLHSEMSRAGSGNWSAKRQWLELNTEQPYLRFLCWESDLKTRLSTLLSKNHLFDIMAISA